MLYTFEDRAVLPDERWVCRDLKVFPPHRELLVLWLRGHLGQDGPPPERPALSGGGRGRIGKLPATMGRARV
jgi:hypothetical protein